MTDTATKPTKNQFAGALGFLGLAIELAHGLIGDTKAPYPVFPNGEECTEQDMKVMLLILAALKVATWDLAEKLFTSDDAVEPFDILQGVLNTEIPVEAPV